MDLFDDKESIRNKVGDLHSTDIPNALGWDKMGPGIMKGVEKRKNRRRMVFWLWGLSMAVIGTVLIGLWLDKESSNLNFAKSKLEIEKTDPEGQKPMKIKNKKVLPVRINSKKMNESSWKTKELNTQTGNVFKVVQRSNDETSYSTLEPPTKVRPASKSTPSSDSDLNSSSRLVESTNTITTSLLLSQRDKVVHVEDSGANEMIEVQMLPALYFKKLASMADPILKTPTATGFQSASLKSNRDTTKWQIEIAGGINWWDQGFNEEGYISSANTSLIGWQFSSRLNRLVGENWSLKIGLDIQKLRFKSAFENTMLIPVYQPNTVDVIYAETITFRDYIPGLQNRRFQNFNEHITWQIPILVGFNIGKNRLKYSLHTGAGLQFLRRNTGRITLKEGAVIDLPDHTIYPTQLSAYYILKTQFAFRVTNKLSVFTKVSMERHFADWIMTRPQLHQRPRIGSGLLGLVWSF